MQSLSYRRYQCDRCQMLYLLRHLVFWTGGSEGVVSWLVLKKKKKKLGWGLVEDSGYWNWREGGYKIYHSWMCDLHCWRIKRQRLRWVCGGSSILFHSLHWAGLGWCWLSRNNMFNSTDVLKCLFLSLAPEIWNLFLFFHFFVLSCLSPLAFFYFIPVYL